MKRGWYDVIIEAIIYPHVVKFLSYYYIDNIPGSGRLDVEALNVFPEDGIVQDLTMFVDDIGD